MNKLYDEAHAKGYHDELKAKAERDLNGKILQEFITRRDLQVRESFSSKFHH